MQTEITNLKIAVGPTKALRRPIKERERITRQVSSVSIKTNKDGEQKFVGKVNTIT